MPPLRVHSRAGAVVEVYVDVDVDVDVGAIRFIMCA
jgi:hypothetical protein